MAPEAVPRVLAAGVCGSRLCVRTCTAHPRVVARTRFVACCVRSVGPPQPCAAPAARGPAGVLVVVAHALRCLLCAPRRPSSIMCRPRAPWPCWRAGGGRAVVPGVPGGLRVPRPRGAARAMPCRPLLVRSANRVQPLPGGARGAYDGLSACVCARARAVAACVYLAARLHRPQAAAAPPARLLASARALVCLWDVSANPRACVRACAAPACLGCVAVQCPDPSRAPVQCRPGTWAPAGSALCRFCDPGYFCGAGAVMAAPPAAIVPAGGCRTQCGQRVCVCGGGGAPWCVWEGGLRGLRA
jgi:hypothetical protein